MECICNGTLARKEENTMRQQDVFASSQILAFNPVLNEDAEVKTQYFVYLRKLIRLVKWDKRKYTKAQIAYYRDILCNKDAPVRVNREIIIPTRMCYLMPYDLAIMLAYHQKVIRTEEIGIIINKIVSDFNLPANSADFLYREFDAALGDKEAWQEVLNSKAVNGFKRYLKIVRENIFFIVRYPYNILITATMSAGKSTLINALVGKNISRMQNMACTSKIHTIISKPFEDGVTSEYDHEILLDASKEDLLSDNEDNFSSKITVGTFFNGCLGGQRVILFDSPGVNSSENAEHREISYKMIRSRRYRLLLYIMNATQLGTNDEDLHLDVVKKHLGRGKILFVMNKIDHLISEDDNLFDVIENQRRFLYSKGFQNPIICPVSARAAYLAKKSQQEELNRIERREMDNYIDKFALNSMADYYEEKLHCSCITDSGDEAKSLFRNCGFAYLEQIIEHLSNGGRINGTGIR